MPSRYRDRKGRFVKKRRGAKRESFSSKTSQRFYKLKRR